MMGASIHLNRWLEKRQRRATAWWGARFHSLPARGPRIALFCDFEGHYAGEDGGKYADPGLDRLLELTARLDIRMTFNVVAELCISHPHRIARIAAAGHEIACHGWRHERPRDLSPDSLDDMLRNARACFNELHLQPTGFRAPESAWSVALLRRLPAHGFLWNAERDTAIRPYRIEPNLVRVPVLTDDWDLADGSSSVSGLMTKWCATISDVIRHGGFAGLGLHEWIVGRDSDFSDALATFLAEMNHRGVQCGSLSEAAGIEPLVAEVTK